MPKVMEWQREKLSNRLAEIQGELDPARLEQEMVLLAQKQDVAEEMDRLEATWPKPAGSSTRVAAKAADWTS